MSNFRANSQTQKPNPFGFGVQNNSQTRQANGFGGSKPNRFKPGENKWSRFSPINGGNSPAPQQPQNQSAAPNHTCTNPESCKREITEDFDKERPLWKLTCYGHRKNGPCDILGDISFEELRSAAYDDAKRGLSLQSIVEKERNLLNSKLVEFENLLRNPYAIPPKSAPAAHTLFTGGSSNLFQQKTQNSAPPSVSSFSQLGASLNIRPAAPTSAFGQVNQSQAFGLLGSQPPAEAFVNTFTPSTTTFGSVGLNAEKNIFPTTAISQSPHLANNNNQSMLINGPNGFTNGVLESAPSTSAVSAGPNLASNLQSSMIFNGRNTSANGVAESSANATMENKNAADNSVWSIHWKRGEIPEEEPPPEARY